MSVEKKPAGYWTKERCTEEALKYTSKKEFREKSSVCYTIVCKNKWNDDVCNHMDILTKPKGYWTKEKCQQLALKYNSRTEFSNSEDSASYKASYKMGWLDDICSHMIKPNIKHTYKECKNVALQYTSRETFKIENRGIYSACCRNGWLEELCSHMPNLRKEKTFDECAKEALKYNTKIDFKNNSSLYAIAVKNKWLEKICLHMTSLHKSDDYYTKDFCSNEALKYSTRTEFQLNSPMAYKHSLKNGWIDEVCSHMIPQGSLKDRYIYAFEFPNENSVYIGLTWNLEERKISHLNNSESSVYKYMNEFNVRNYIFKELGYYDLKIAIQKEEEFLQQYKLNNWLILNRAKTGGVGKQKGKVWSFEECEILVSECKGRNDFKEKYNRAYLYAKEKEWLDVLCPKSPRKSIWSKDKCVKEALKYNTKTDFIIKSNTAYNVARKNNWLNDICSHMVEIKFPNGYWTYEKCEEIALLCETRNEFVESYKSAYHVSHKNGWLNDICSHMKNGNQIRGDRDRKWTYEVCKTEASKYNTRKEFKKENKFAYQASVRYKWINEICKHMIVLHNSNGHWDNKENCKIEASKYKGKNEFSKNSRRAYDGARKNGWLDEFFPKK